MSIKAGDVLKVTRKDVGEGWWEGQSASGQTGLFPAAYVQVRSEHLLIVSIVTILFFYGERVRLKCLSVRQEVNASQPPAMPPPPLPESFNNDDWGENQTNSNYANTQV